MKKALWIGSLLLASATTWAATVTDDFNRADTISSTDTSLIGADWAQAAGSANRWRIGSGTVISQNDSAQAIMYNTAQETLCGAATGGTTNSFVLGLDVAMEVTSNVWAGVVFNYQDENNFYCFRVKSGSAQYQVLAMVGGAWSVLQSGNAAATFAYGSDVFYRLTVASDIAYGFNVKIRRVSDGVVLAQAEALDGGENFSDGYAGLYLGSLIPGEVHEFAKWDNFNLDVSGYGDIAFDYFNGTNTPQTAYTVNVDNADWIQAGDGVVDIGSDWFVNDGVLRLRNRQANAVMYNTGLETVSGNGTNFTLKADVYARVANVWVGVVFNYTDESNYYVFRIKGGATDYQLLQKTGAGDSWDLLLNEDLAIGDFAVGAYHTVTISSDTAGGFDVAVDAVVDTTVDDSSSALEGGYAGLYGSFTSAHIAHFDDFRLVVSGPSVHGYAAWAMGWGGVDIGAEGDDYDADGLNNLYEYGLGGDPTNALDQGTSPEFAVVEDAGGDFFGYIYPQLSDPQSGLSYHLALNTDLATGSWVDAGYVVEGTNVTGGALDFVTNTTDLVEDQKFIRLIIE